MGFLNKVGVYFFLLHKSGDVFQFGFVSKPINIMAIHSKICFFCETFVGPRRYYLCRRWRAVIVSCVAEWIEIIVIGLETIFWGRLCFFCDCYGRRIVIFSFFIFFIFFIFFSFSVFFVFCFLLLLLL